MKRAVYILINAMIVMMIQPVLGDVNSNDYVDLEGLSDLSAIEMPAAKVENIIPKAKKLLSHLQGPDTEQSLGASTNLVEVSPEKAPEKKQGALVGYVMNYHSRKLTKVKVTLFNDDYYREMTTTARGNFGFSVPVSNEYTLSAQLGQQYYYTNLVLNPAEAYHVPIRFTSPINIRGRLIIDGKPAQCGVFLRVIGKDKSQRGSLVLTNGFFKIDNLIPGKYTVVLERRKRFIDHRINENRFYYFTAQFTNSSLRISVIRDRRKLSGKIKLDELPQVSLSAIVTLKDAKSNGMLIHREAYTYNKGGFFTFNNILPGYYTLQAAQSNREWKSKKFLVRVKKSDQNTKYDLDVVTDPTKKTREIENLKRQFRR